MLLDSLLSLKSIYVIDAFEEVYKNPQKCVHGTQSFLRNKDMKDSVNVGKKLIFG
jgi:hypothetical protein